MATSKTENIMGYWGEYFDLSERK